jgi:hypothetical protein
MSLPPSCRYRRLGRILRTIDRRPPGCAPRRALRRALRRDFCPDLPRDLCRDFCRDLRQDLHCDLRRRRGSGFRPLGSPSPLRAAVIALGLSIVASPALSGTEVGGVDSLAARTIDRALGYLDLGRGELGFDKLYAEDDTFRLPVVEHLLNDPLSLPAWQDDVVHGLSPKIRRPASLLRTLGGLVDAAGEPVPEGPELTASAGPVRARAGDRNETGQDAPGTPTADEARSARQGMKPESGPADTSRVQGADRSERAIALTRRIGAFLEQVGTAERSLDQAFAALSAADRERLLVLAPAFWGDWEQERGERARKGAIHFELGAAADTSFKIDEDPVLDLAVKLDRPALTRAAAEFLSALTALTDDLAADRAGKRLPAAERSLDGVTGPIIASVESPWGLCVVGGPASNEYSPEALDRIAFLIDPGGDDVYRGRAASAVGGLLRPMAALVDLDGNDLYDSGGRSYALGGAVLGVAALLDLDGNDTYRGDDGAEGAGFFGAGFLYDGSGVDFFDGRNLCQGAGAFGLGALVSDCTADPPPGPEVLEDRPFEEGFRKVPPTGAVPIRYDDNDTYLCARFSQGFASTFGAGLLLDRNGADSYRAGGRYLHRPLLPSDFQSLSQGYSIGFRPRAGGGVGILMDETGNDFYNGEVYSQGAGYWYSVGLLYDGAGNDSYDATQYSQGAGIHLAVGSLWDRGGDDRYTCKLGVTQGTGHDLSVGALIDEEGRDYYLVSDGQGVSLTNSVGLFIDGQGDDVYATPGKGQGWVRWGRGFCGASLFLDLEGKDTYPAGAPGQDGSVWLQEDYGVGIDLDRNVTFPGEIVPEIVLTAADSLRKVDELFETASLWEVGSAREKVRRARKALIARGTEAVDYAVANKLATRDGLEYRAIEELAKAYPDTFTARVLPRLQDKNPRVRANVIRLLGDLKREEARAPLESMLGRPVYQKQWVGILDALGKIGDIASGDAIRPFLENEGERRRIYAAVALAALDDTTSTEALVSRLRDPVFTVRAAASRALVRLGAASVGPLGASLESRPEQRAVQLRTLGGIGIALKDSTDERSVLARALVRRTLMAELDRPPGESAPATRAAAVEALMRMGGEETRDFVGLRMLDEPDPLVRRTYGLELEKINQPHE